MAAQAPWTQHEPETGDDDRWHVMVAPGEVKILTLEQLDDLFRLEIIDENTSVRQSHMTGWLPLGVVAGLEAEPATPGGGAAPSSSGRSPAPPAQPTRSAPPAPRLVATVPPSPAQVAAAFAAPAQSTRPPAAGYPSPPASGAQSWPSAGPSPAQAALFAPVPSVQVASETLRPMASESDIAFHSRSSGGGGWLIALAVLLGTGVTLYRNGVVRDVARSSGQEAIYGRLEAAVGGPSFGTLRAVEQLDVAAMAPLRAGAAAQAFPLPEPHSERAAEPAVTAKAESPSTHVAGSTHALRLEDLAPEKGGAASPTGGKPVSLEALPQPDAVTPHPVTRTPPAAKHAPPATAPSRAVASSSHAAPVKRRAKDASRMYDPLNPDL